MSNVKKFTVLIFELGAVELPYTLTEPQIERRAADHKFSFLGAFKDYVIAPAGEKISTPITHRYIGGFVKDLEGNSVTLYKNGEFQQRGDHLKAKEIIKDLGKRLGNFGPQMDQNAPSEERVVERIERDGFLFRFYEQESMSVFIGGGAPKLGGPKVELWATYERI